jgi:hypothetical protein
MPAPINPDTLLVKPRDPTAPAPKKVLYLGGLEFVSEDELE